MIVLPSGHAWAGQGENDRWQDFKNTISKPVFTGLPAREGSDSLLVRFTRNCPWNHCTFCGMYKEREIRTATPGRD